MQTWPWKKYVLMYISNREQISHEMFNLEVLKSIDGKNGIISKVAAV